MSLVDGDHGIPVCNAWYLLLYAWNLAAFGESWRVAAEEAPALLGLLGRVLADASEHLLKRNLAHRHNSRVETVRGIRGRIDFGRTLAGLQLYAGRTTCRFSALDIDTPQNRILRASLQRLAHDPRLTPGAPKHADALRTRLRVLVRQMEGVTLTRVSEADFARLQLGRSDEMYVLPLTICRLIHDLRIPAEDAGDHAVRALVRDEVNFRSLFERFVRNFWRLHAANYTVESEVLSWHDEHDNSLVPTMRTDITVTERVAPRRRLIVDTKFAKHTLVRSLHGPLRFHTDHLYQLYTYLRTQEHRGDAFRSAAGLLLYPTTNLTDDQSMRVQGHTIRVAALDLSAPWPEIEGRLHRILADSFPPVSGPTSP